MPFASGSKPLLILDGGFGTTLEDIFHKDISTPLWSAGPIANEPEVVINTHLAFLRAGANVILTSTYQCAFSTVEQAGFSRDDAIRLMRKSVLLAAEARTRYTTERKEAHLASPHIKIALSLGSFGATLSPAQEFDGFYPPPFGPKKYDQTGASENCNTFDDPEAERRATKELEDFHLQRIKVFADDPLVWEAIDFIAFETVPLTREIRAIRRAVRRLEETMGGMKPWWISTVHPKGEFPEQNRATRVQMQEVVQALLGPDENPTSIPDGIGINCISMEYTERVLAELSKTVERREGPRPWLVVYPNGGELWDPITRTWKPGASGEAPTGSWAQQLGLYVQAEAASGIWGGVIVGGCCKTGPAEISELALLLSM